jgi:hypothetical protein
LKDQIWQNVAELEVALAHVVNIYKLIEEEEDDGSYFLGRGGEGGRGGGFRGEGGEGREGREGRGRGRGEGMLIKPVLKFLSY